MFRSVLRTVSKGSRSIHTVPSLPNQEALVKNGIPGVYTTNQLKTVWFDNQLKLSTELSILTSGTPDESRSPFSIALISSKDSTRQKVFNLSSSLFNNHFCIEQLIPSSQITKPSRSLELKITEDFGLLDNLKHDILELSQSIIGQGYIFLIEDENKKLALKQINNSGTPFKFSSNLSLDLNGPIDSEEAKYLKALKKDLEDGVEDYSLPLWGINLWDVAYLGDYGIRGKQQYVENVWNSTNWDVVNKRVFKF